MAIVQGKRLILVGAEGCAEIEGEAWFHQASRADEHQFFDHVRTTFAKQLGDADPRELLVDGNNRPYWLLVVHENAPAVALRKSEQFTRCMRLHVEF